MEKGFFGNIVGKAARGAAVVAGLASMEAVPTLQAQTRTSLTEKAPAKLSSFNLPPSPSPVSGGSFDGGTDLVKLATTRFKQECDQFQSLVRDLGKIYEELLVLMDNPNTSFDVFNARYSDFLHGVTGRGSSKEPLKFIIEQIRSESFQGKKEWIEKASNSIGFNDQFMLEEDKGSKVLYNYYSRKLAEKKKLENEQTEKEEKEEARVKLETPKAVAEATARKEIPTPNPAVDPRESIQRDPPAMILMIRLYGETQTRLTNLEAILKSGKTNYGKLFERLKDVC